MTSTNKRTASTASINNDAPSSSHVVDDVDMSVAVALPPSSPSAASSPSSSSPSTAAKRSKTSNVATTSSIKLRSSSSSSSSASSSSSSSSSLAALTPASYSALAASHAVRFKSYCASTSVRASSIMTHVLPRKVLELDYLCQHHPPFVSSISPPFGADGAILPGRSASEPIPSNASVMALIPIVKAEVVYMIEQLGALKLMIQLRIPAVDDGNNFGVEIQEESIGEIAKTEDVAFAYLEKIGGYITNRTRVIAKISKYPMIADFWQAVNELDESFYTDLRLHAVEMRNSYATISDLLKKNEERIKNPRGESDGEGRNRRHAFA